MNRRHFLATSSMTVIAAALNELPLVGYQGQPPPTVTEFKDIRRGVGIFNGRGGTIGWLVSPEGVVVVDTQFPDTAQACVNGLKQKTTRTIDLLINTHHHGDHTAGNKTFRPVVKSIVAHANSASWQKKVAAEAKTEADQAYPDKTFTDTWSETVGREKVSARHYGPGHTSGDAVITFENANVVHMGDLMFNRLHPFIDRPAGASIANWMKTLETVPSQHSADTIYIFGHGKDMAVTGGRAEIQKFRDYLGALLDYARKQRQAGKSKEEISKTETLAGYEDYGSPAPGRITLGTALAVAYDEVSAR